MNLEGLVVPADAGSIVHGLATDLFPICRSITGDGLRRTLATIQTHIPLQIQEIPSGTPVLDWTIPREWNIRDAYIKDGAGRRVVDFQQSNLHVVNYSVPVHERMSLTELRPHLHTRPDRPDWIPYRTAYYREEWGFCLTHRQLETLEDGTYEVVIDSSLDNGSLTFGEYVLRGERSEEVLISSHVCHPSLANDNVSGVALATVLAGLLSNVRLRLSYRFLFAPATIGAIAWLARNGPAVSRIRHGLVLACVGDGGIIHYKKSRQGSADIDRAMEHVLKHAGDAYHLRNFEPLGYDERQYCSPGFNLPVGAFTRTPHGQYAEYHTSADNLELIRPAFLADSLAKLISVVAVLEQNRYYVNCSPFGEPQLGRRGLYEALGGGSGKTPGDVALLWVLNLADGTHSLLDIAERANLDFDSVRRAGDLLAGNGLLREAEADPFS